MIEHLKASRDVGQCIILLKRRKPGDEHSAKRRTSYKNTQQQRNKSA